MYFRKLEHRTLILLGDTLVLFLICVLYGEAHLILYAFDKGHLKWGHSLFRTNGKNVPENSTRTIIVFI